MSYFGDNEVMGGIAIGDDEYDNSYLSDGMMDMSVYHFGEPLDPYSPIQNEPMGRDYNPNNFNSSNPAVKSNYRYNPLSTYDLDTGAVFSNHMYGNPSFYRDRDAQWDASTPNPQRNSFNVEQDFMQDYINSQAPLVPPDSNARTRIKGYSATPYGSGGGDKSTPVRKEKMENDTSSPR